MFVFRSNEMLPGIQFVLGEQNNGLQVSCTCHSPSSHTPQFPERTRLIFHITTDTQPYSIIKLQSRAPLLNKVW